MLIKRKILHRDIKPSNVLIDKNRVPYLTDFGLAKFIDSKSVLTQTGSAIGTPFYMSPEQIRGIKSQIDHRSDVYGLGIILYQILTSRLPFSSDSVAELYRLITDQEPPSPKELNPELSSPLQAICLKSIEKKANYRYQSVKDFL